MKLSTHFCVAGLLLLLAPYLYAGSLGRVGYQSRLKSNISTSEESLDSLLSLRVSAAKEKALIPFRVIIQWGHGSSQRQIQKFCKPEASFLLPRGEALHLRILAGESTMVYEGWQVLDCAEVELAVEVHHWGSFQKDWHSFSFREIGSMSSGIEKRLCSVAGVGPRAWSIGEFVGPVQRYATPSDWIGAKALGENIHLIEGLSRNLDFEGMFWSPLALGLLKGDVWGGVILADKGDESIYLKLLEAGFRLPCFSQNLRFDPMSDHLVKTEDPSWVGIFDAMSEGKIIMGQQVSLSFSVKDPKSDGARYGIGDVVPVEKGYSWVPELKFEVNPQLGGIKKVELYRGEQLIQESLLRTALRNGEATFSVESFEAGDALLVKLIRVNGDVVMSNPIYFGVKAKGIRYYPLEMSWPLKSLPGRIKVIQASEVKEWSMAAGDAWAEFLSLDARLEILLDNKVHHLTVWEILFDNSALEMRHPMGVLEQISLWESKFPLKIQVPLE